MNGFEHYQRSEELLANVDHPIVNHDHEEAMEILAKAQVHATLAQAATNYVIRRPEEEA